MLRLFSILISHLCIFFLDVFVDDVIIERDLGLLPTGFFNHYDNTVNPGITVGFATAAFRFGHSQV